jgi:hypothetical protein
VPAPDPTAADDQAVAEISNMLVRIEYNYLRETSAPGTRFEGQRLEDVQARAVLRRLREIGWQP